MELPQANARGHMSVGPKLGVLALVVVSIGLPINTLWSYLFVLVAAVARVHHARLRPGGDAMRRAGRACTFVRSF